MQYLIDGMHDATVGKAGRPIAKDRLRVKLRKKMEFYKKNEGKLAVNWTGSLQLLLTICPR